ncbi:GrpB family protein [Salipaludibacillus sp. LMS25]|jgi:GrpB-like predicted nucleotidyltransferase (UPF0157 family)|uniref:GrpB family protein n=1 Tax=Salipaludibacillus sp. LMS25 TaxID=2924031 RepID=UPI0020D0F1F9|nr:GrpB family protein [Salipaludibacillus sp. LMS25]UTR16507.1 GrpB family protein [Salipaludibacillus sp. LMS25]
MRKVEVKPFNENWSLLFEEESKKLSGIFGDQVIEVHHIGSTAVPGLRAKPIIDMMPVVKNIESVEAYNEDMMAIGYEPKGENGIQERRYFQKGGDNRTHHVHVYQHGNNDIIRHLAFRDYLTAYPEKKKEYGDLKHELAKRYPYNIVAYMSGKEGLIKEIEKHALQWYVKNKSPC